jgi:2-polyprenyl-3-methyl-5-hydroxy-6-metoxy-1,4-benzoquinol methylase
MNSTAILARNQATEQLMGAEGRLRTQGHPVAVAGRGDSGPNPEHIMQLAWSFAGPMILETALQFRLFDRLAESPRTFEELAESTGASKRGLRAILNALVGMQLLQHRSDSYELTPESSAYLVSTKPGYHGLLFRHIIWQVLPEWMKLPEVIRTGRPATAVNHEEEGAGFFAQFVEALFPLSYPAAVVAGEYLGIPGTKTPLHVLDLGAGSGVWGIALAHLSSLVRVRAIDWPRVLSVTRSMARKHGVANRIETIAGDLHEVDFGSGYHVAVLGQVLHSEGAERSRRLLRKVFAALAPGGRVIISEFLTDENRQGPITPLFFAVNMLVHTEAGDTFTVEELNGWLQDAGFENVHLLKAPGVSPLLIANRS